LTGETLATDDTSKVGGFTQLTCGVAQHAELMVLIDETFTPHIVAHTGRPALV